MTEQIKKNLLVSIVCVVLLLAAFLVFGTLQAKASEIVEVSTEQELVAEINNAETEKIIKLNISSSGKVLEINETLEIPQGKVVTIDLNGAWLQSDPPDFLEESEGMVLMEIGGVLTVRDTYEGEKGGLYGNHEATVVVDETGTFSLESGTITSAPPNDGMFGEYNGVHNEGTFNMSGGKIEGCDIESYGGAIYAKGAVNITGGEIANCSARNGGAIAVVGDMPVNIRNLKIHDCTAREAGGAIYTESNTSVNIACSRFYNNKAAFIGGAIATVPGTKMTLINTEITGNIGGRDGGVTNACSNGNFIIGGKVVIFNNRDDSEHQSNLAIMENSSIAIDCKNPLCRGSKIGIYQSENTTGDIVVSSGAKEEYVNKCFVTDYPDTDRMSYVNNGCIKIERKPFIVSFVTKSGTEIASQQVYRFNHAVDPGDPGISGWSFDGWFSSPDFKDDELWIFEANLVESDITLYARLAPLPYKDVPVELLTAKTAGNRAIKLSWSSIPGANKYVVYGQKCGKKYKKLKTTNGNTYTVKKISRKRLKAHKNYKFYVVACTANGTVSSKAIHFITGNRNGKYANVKSIKAKAGTLTLNAGEASKIGATYKMYYGKKHIKKSHGAALRYISNCPSVAAVSSSGTVTAKAPGTATIYIQDLGGKYCKTIVTVK